MNTPPNGASGRARHARLAIMNVAEEPAPCRLAKFIAASRLAKPLDSSPKSMQTCVFFHRWPLLDSRGPALRMVLVADLTQVVVTTCFIAQPAHVYTWTALKPHAFSELGQSCFLVIVVVLCRFWLVIVVSSPFLVSAPVHTFKDVGA